jgi:hypothetical protein
MLYADDGKRELMMAPTIRLRPLSNNEIERGCEEAVYKDGKMSLTVRGINGQPDAKKVFDFDQVFELFT